MGWKKRLAIECAIYILAVVSALFYDFIGGSLSNVAMFVAGWLFCLNGWAVVFFKGQEARIEKLEQKIRDMEGSVQNVARETRIMKL